MNETEAITGDMEPKFSCTAVIGEAVLLLGGIFEDRQISQLSPLGIIRIGTLPFSFAGGTCLVMGSQLFLGFPAPLGNELAKKSCWSR